jgi:molybdate transport system permease protein
MLSPEELSALWLSIRVALVGVAVSIPPGVALAWLLARRPFVGKSLVDALVHLPLVLPPVAVGYLLLTFLGRRSLIGGFLSESLGIDLAFTWKAAAIASAVMGFPLLVRSTRLAIELVDRRTEEAARTLGAGPGRVAWTITLPLALPGILAGITLAFARSLGEFGATITFAGNIEGETRTLPAAIYTYTQLPDGDGPAMRLLAISIVVAFAALVASEFLARRSHARLVSVPGGVS